MLHMRERIHMDVLASKHNTPNNMPKRVDYFNFFLLFAPLVVSYASRNR